MSKKPIEVCLDDTYLCARISYLGYNISKRRPNTYSIEDGKQELWEAVVRRLPEHDGKSSVTEFAGSAAYSRYGHIISEHGNKAEDLFEWSIRGGDFSVVPTQDRVLELIEANITLDEIEASLYNEVWKERSYKIALSSIKFLRQGYTRTETAEKVGVSTQQMKYVMARVRHHARKVL